MVAPGTGDGLEEAQDEVPLELTLPRLGWEREEAPGWSLEPPAGRT